MLKYNDKNKNKVLIYAVIYNILLNELYKNSTH